jgi:hypothetical protein
VYTSAGFIVQLYTLKSILRRKTDTRGWAQEW